MKCIKGSESVVFSYLYINSTHNTGIELFLIDRKQGSFFHYIPRCYSINQRTLNYLKYSGILYHMPHGKYDYKFSFGSRGVMFTSIFCHKSPSQLDGSFSFGMESVRCFSLFMILVDPKTFIDPTINGVEKQEKMV